LEDPRATKKSLIRKVRQLAQHLEQEKHLSHTTSLQVQGKLFDVTTKEAGVAWSHLGTVKGEQECDCK